MKEAAGEANMTVVTIVLIAIVLGVGTVIVNNLMSSTAKKSACSELGGVLEGSTCIVTTQGGVEKKYNCSKGADGNWTCSPATS